MLCKYMPSILQYEIMNIKLILNVFEICDEKINVKFFYSLNKTNSDEMSLL